MDELFVVSDTWSRSVKCVPDCYDQVWKLEIGDELGSVKAAKWLF